jgi:hypothetical protein
MTSSELRTIIGKSKLDYATKLISSEQLIAQLQQIDFANAVDDNGNLKYLKDLVDNTLAELQQQ